jgi:molybdate transport system regulatory protein
MKTKSVRVLNLQPRLRVRVGDEIAIGPGKVELLKWVRQTGSISEAARRMGMSYMRAWTLVQTMNRCFKQPLVLTARGGKSGGGAQLTATGRKALECYQAMEKAGLRAGATQWRQFRRILRG